LQNLHGVSIRIVYGFVTYILILLEMVVANNEDLDEQRRGRSASYPREISAAGWKDILVRVWAGLNNDNVAMVAAGVAFYFLLAIFPAMGATVSIYGLISDPADVQQQLAQLTTLLPKEAQTILSQQLNAVASQSSQALSISLVGSILLALWSTTRGVKALITALNIVYNEHEKRSFLKLNAVALLLTVGAIIFLILALSLVVALPALLGNFGLQDYTRVLILIARWLLLGFIVITSLAVLYRYGPCRKSPRWQWVSWGAILAAFLWLVGSALFSYYVGNFASYNETYGALGAIVILLMWFYLTAYVILLSAEVNAETEHQTAQDTTIGGDQPRGQRGAFVADTIGDSYGK
jgi:membrane protein